MARGLFVEATAKNPNVFLPILPNNYLELYSSLQLQLVNEIQQLQGPFTIELQALEFLREWYMARIPPTSEAAQAGWNRHRELALKVAMILCAGEPGTRKSITQPQLYEAISLVEEVKATEKTLWSYINTKGKIQDVDWVAARIEKAGRIEHSVLLCKVSSNRGILKTKLFEIISTLESTGRITSHRIARRNCPESNTGKLIYTWVGGRPNIISADPDDDEE